jgi:hypothetical protein
MGGREERTKGAQLGNNSYSNICSNSICNLENLG